MSDLVINFSVDRESFDYVVGLPHRRPPVVTYREKRRPRENFREGPDGVKNRGREEGSKGGSKGGWGGKEESRSMVDGPWSCDTSGYLLDCVRKGSFSRVGLEGERGCLPFERAGRQSDGPGRPV